MKVTNIPSILLDLYKKSYDKHLRMKIEENAFTFDTFEQFVKNSHSQDDVEKILLYKMLYKNEESVNWKIKDLIKEEVKPIKYLDFGYGDGIIPLKVCKHFNSIQYFYGIEVSDSVFEFESNVIPFFHKSIFELADHVDLTTCIHTLHHINISEQENILKNIYDKLSLDGIFYLVEDSWSNKNKKIDFPVCGSSYIRSIFEINDRVANNWFYSRNLECNKEYYRSSEDWLDLLSIIGFDIINASYTGFNINRLHGVPNISIIAKKTANKNF